LLLFLVVLPSCKIFFVKKSCVSSSRNVYFVILSGRVASRSVYFVILFYFYLFFFIYFFFFEFGSMWTVNCSHTHLLFINDLLLFYFVIFSQHIYCYFVMLFVRRECFVILAFRSSRSIKFAILSCHLLFLIFFVFLSCRVAFFTAYILLFCRVAFLSHILGNSSCRLAFS